ncbi:efflux RND transporter periplasmic adaptor subunit [Clostridium estertheticum]|uniref:efflux RND transporter periplasmic adaptor subunit n=1 Tax=Clostridium estertheticum TaxID=238834 RepID=UPI001CF128CE|nr:efflux RND transporter periplasmic adaptor subunit [Clostridium estertheticum]MCB2357140.1 efflux RND transporter periplasmic adaptor subunit [Clostridium estertheticum]WAG40752.1 efflux RND transporter periplasmic adaptor subunit [Clostridium estertheticum]
MKKKIIIGVVIVAIMGIIGGIQFTSRNKKQVITVKTSKVSIGDVKMYLSTTATIKSKNEKDYSVSTATKISNVKVSVGDKVKKGDIILIYDTADLNNQQESAQINYNNAISQKKDAVNKNDNANVLSDEKINQLDNAVLAAQNTLDSVKIKLSQNSNITSDIDGVVTEVNVISGQTGGQGTAIIVQDISNLKGIVKVGKYDAAKVAIGQSATILSSGKSYKAKVSKIYPTATINTTATGGDTTLTVEIDVLEAAPQLKVNFDSDVDILLNQVLATLKVPAQSILTNKDGSTYLFVVSDGKAVQRNVKLGLQSDTDMEIVSGVKVGESVILNPGSSITNGVMVKDSINLGGK